ncbi:MAG: hypothetical protein ACOCRX_05700 [Candidatus Woesearchaeota archaeon]
MEIVKAAIGHAKEISELMLSDLKNPNSKFPQKMINIFREHAKEENILKEFNNPGLIAFIAKNKGKVLGFIVGYEDTLNYSTMIHYITANEIEIKKELLDQFIKECKLKNIKKIITDTFEFMENKDFFELNKFRLMKKEEVAPDLEMLWYELNLN